MLKEADFIEEWMDEARTQTSCKAAARVLAARFGPLSPDIQVRIEELSEEQCMELLERAVIAKSLAELGF